MRPLLLIILLCSTLPAVEVGEGAPSLGIQILFQQAYFRSGFHLQVGEPAGQVRRWASTGLIQEFLGKSDTDPHAALIKPTATDSLQADGSGVFQVYSGIFNYYNSLGASTVGFPTIDTQQCPSVDLSLCTYQFFDKGYALFSYSKSLFTGQNFQVKGVFYTRWTALGGVSGIGIPTDNEASATSVKATTATVQTFTAGAIYSITSGATTGSTFGVGGPIYKLYQTQNAHAGSLGFPIRDEYSVSSTRRRQDFEGGAIEYTPGSDAELRLPVSAVSLGRFDNAGSVKLNLGETIQVTAVTYSSSGLELSGRPVTWSTTNSRVITVQPSGSTAVLTAVGGGSASVIASSEGKSSAALILFVSAPCCQVGEGAPTADIQQAFQDAVTRARISVALPNPSPVRSGGAGYYQELVTVSGQKVMVAKSAASPAAFLVSSEILTSYLAAGGPGGTLGYPLSDATAAGRQIFEGGALAGSPALLVSGTILAKWARLEYETGVAGQPMAAAAAFLSVNATAGTAQSFRGGAIYAISTGARSGQAFYVSGAVLARYQAIGGAAGDLGAPTSDESGGSGVFRQTFENGAIEYAAGGEAQERLNERRPAVTALPSTVVAGSRVRVLVSGFPAGSTLRVSVTGRPDFSVSTANGAYTWEAYIPPGASSGSVTVRAVDAAGGAQAETSYVVRSLAQSRLQIVKMQGDGQTAPPGTVLPATLKVAVRDESKAPVVGVVVTFAASPGSQLEPASIATNENGEAEVKLRLPLTPGVALATAEAGGAVVTFSAQASAVTIANFPAQRATSPVALGKGSATIARKGALLAATSSIVRYYQNRGDAAATNGLAEPVLLNEYLKGFCTFDAQGSQICDGFLSGAESGEQVVNLWRLSEFTSNTLDVSVEGADLSTLGGLVAQGHPVLLGLALSMDSMPSGGHFVVATGVAQDGGLMIHDPSATLARTRLSEYLQGFSAGGHTYSAKLTAAVRLAPRAPSARRFLLATISAPAVADQSPAFAIRSVEGPCGATLGFSDAAVAGEVSPSSQRLSRFAVCDGSQAVYQLAVSGAGSSLLTDLAGGGGVRQFASGLYSASRPAAALQVSVLTPLVSAAVVNAAAPEAGLAPGTLAKLTGAGLADANGNVTVTVGGLPARIANADPFQVLFEIPLDVATGSQSVRLESPYGSWEQPVAVREVAPAIFPRAVWNQNGATNSARAPALRGQSITLYATGLGRVSLANGFDITRVPVKAILNGIELPVSFAGSAPSLVGVYQVNLDVPVWTPPGLDLPLTLSQGETVSAVAQVSIE